MEFIYFSCVFLFIVFSSNTNVHGNKVVSKKLIAEKAYQVIPSSLNSIVESTIFNLIEIKKYYPSGNYTDIIEELNEIAQTYPDTTIRIKAYLATIYLSSSNIIDVQPMENYYEHDYLFRQIAQQLENKLLVSK